MSNNRFFPLFVDISEKRILVVGAGEIARRRVRTLIDFCRHVTVVAPNVHPELEALAREGRICLLRREYRREDLQNMWMVLAATDDSRLNEEICAQAKALGALVNAANNQAKCDFHFPGIVRKDPYVVGINASGKDHHGAALLRQRIQETIAQWEEETNR